MNHSTVFISQVQSLLFFSFCIPFDSNLFVTITQFNLRVNFHQIDFDWYFPRQTESPSDFNGFLLSNTIYNKSNFAPHRHSFWSRQLFNIIHSGTEAPGVHLAPPLSRAVDSRLDCQLTLSKFWKYMKQIGESHEITLFHTRMYVLT